jgi:hypothetical protein
MPKLFKLPFDREEEQYLRLYLNVNAKGGDKDLLLIAYYLQKGEYATAISHYNSIASDVAKVQSMMNRKTDDWKTFRGVESFSEPTFLSFFFLLLTLTNFGRV